MSTVFIALGGNLDNVPEAFHAARDEISQLSDSRLIASSNIYRTPPIGPPGQPDYYNAVICIQTTLAPIALLDALQACENKHGRVRQQHWGARTLDLDIVAIDHQCIELPRLHIPHPLMHTRQFVLRPLCDIKPNWQHPRTGQAASSLLADILATGETALAEGVAW